jgi:hypothetical protein
VKATFENDMFAAAMPKNKAQAQARKIPLQGGSQQKQFLNTAP